MENKNEEHSQLIKEPRLFYDLCFEDTLVRTKESIRVIYERIYNAFRVIQNVLLERLDSAQHVAYIKLFRRPVAPHTIMPTIEPPVRRVFLPIKRFRGQR